MPPAPIRKRFFIALLFLAGAASSFSQAAAQNLVSHANLLKGAYGRYRSNNHVVSYHLDVRVDPVAKTIAGKNTIRLKMLRDDSRIQLDLVDEFHIDKIALGPQELQYERDGTAVFVDFPQKLEAGKTYDIVFAYSGHPKERGPWSGIEFGKDPSGHDWITTSCEGIGASSWWPNKDQWRDKCESMQISVAIPNNLVDVSNGKFMGKTDLGDGFTRWDWAVHYSIDNYDVALNIGNYVHFADNEGSLPLNYFVLPENLEKAKRQFSQVNGMIRAYQHYFGEYPFKNDGYKLVEVPYAGMEHQSAVAYGNGYKNSYVTPDLIGVGISPRFDFIIIHESGHEWFGNSISAADRSDMWIHEGWTTYLECLYVEYTYGKADGLKYTNGYQHMVNNRRPIVGARGVADEPRDNDQYFKGALFLNTLRSMIDDDNRWFGLIHDFYQRFKHSVIMTEDVVKFFNEKTHMNLTPIFDQYLRYANLVTLELKFGNGTVDYRWKSDEPAFAMPIKAGAKDHWQLIHPTTTWQTMKTTLGKDEFDIPRDLYYVKVVKE